MIPVVMVRIVSFSVKKGINSGTKTPVIKIDLYKKIAKISITEIINRLIKVWNQN